MTPRTSASVWSDFTPVGLNAHLLLELRSILVALSMIEPTFLIGHAVEHAVEAHGIADAGKSASP